MKKILETRTFPSVININLNDYEIVKKNGGSGFGLRRIENQEEDEKNLAAVKVAACPFCGELPELVILNSHDDLLTQINCRNENCKMASSVYSLPLTKQIEKCNRRVLNES